MPIIKSLTQQVCDHIVNQIKFGELTAGEKLDELKLIKDLQISRTPIREALIQLAADGIIDNMPRKGFYVKSWDVQSMLEAYKIMACLDIYAVTLAIDLLNDSDYNSMNHAIEEMDLSIKQHDYPAYCMWQEKFHLVYLRRGGNKTLYEMIQNIKKQYLRQTYYNKDHDKLFSMLEVSNSEHKEILTAIIAKNNKKLEKVIVDHWTKYDPEMW